jgi:NAD+ synthase (glutamine-hydrolysing)
VPDDEARLAQDCYEAYNIQVSGLEQRMRAIGGGDRPGPKIVIGVSGGLDSTHALIVAAKACDRLGLPRTHILASRCRASRRAEHTKSNAIRLMESLGITWEELDIRPAATQMLKDLGHPFGRGEEVYDVTFENVQAGLRTDYLFRPPTSAAASCSAPATCPSWRSAGARTASATRCRTTGSTPACPRR